MREYTFTVDTHLFRELGELLVGRDSTALMELVKNSYDADATRVTVFGEGLRNGQGKITITDDGIGMNPEVFSEAFLRIAGRYKERGTRTSPRFGRRYTGAKGVGRLSAQKLAKQLRLHSVADAVVMGGADTARGVDARIDWEAIDQIATTIDDVGNGLAVSELDVPPTAKSGTLLELTGIRSKWSGQRLKRLVEQVESSVAPIDLIEPPAFDIEASHAPLGKITPWTRRLDDPGFTVELVGDFDTGDNLWLRALERCNWLLEIDATASGVVFAIHPTPRTLREYPNAQHYVLRRDHPNPQEGPFFTARIYNRVGSAGDDILRDFVSTHSGIRVYLEGFQVVPYGEPGNDWLSLDRDSVRRRRGFEENALDDTSVDELPEVKNSSFRAQGNLQYMGAVFLTAEGASSLRPVVNREGFLQDDHFANLTQLVRNGVDLLVRTRAAVAAAQESEVAVGQAEAPETTSQQGNGPATKSSPEAKDAADTAVKPPAPRRSSNTYDKAQSSRQAVKTAIDRTRRTLVDLKEAVKADQPEASERLDEATAAVDNYERLIDHDQDAQETLRVLASVGLQFSTFIHDVNGLLSQANAIRDLTKDFSSTSSAATQAAMLKQVRESVETLGQSLARMASYLTELVGPDARRRRRRIVLRDAVDSTLSIVSGAVAEREVTIVNDIDSELRTPPVFPAELSIVYLNLLTNAIKACEQKGKILLRAEQLETGLEFRVENTGNPVDLVDAERWFSPFESTTTEVDFLLGQGMGLGLVITRRVIGDYGGEIHFVVPSPGYATAVQFNLPARKVTNQP